MSFLNRCIVKLEDEAALASYASQVCFSLRSDKPLQNSTCFCENIRMKLIKRMKYRKAGFALLRQRVLHRIKKPRLSMW